MLKRRRIGLLVIGSIIGCSQFAGTDRFGGAAVPTLWYPDGSGPKVHVVMVAIDGTRWQEIFRGVDPKLAAEAHITEASTAEELVPNLTALARRGVALGDDGSEFHATGPNYVSLPGYAEMLSGHPVFCQENDCTARPDHTIADTFREAGASQADVAIITSWERIDNVATRESWSATVSAGRHGGSTRDEIAKDPELGPLLEAGEEVSSQPGHDDYRPDRYTVALATAYFEKVRPRFLFVSLGDTDEYGHRGDYRGYLGALRDADSMVGRFAATAAEWEKNGDQVMIVVTTDHGRDATFREHGGKYPESARTWMIAAGGPFVMPEQGYKGMHHLADIAPTLELALGMGTGSDSETGKAMAALLRSRTDDEARLATLGTR